MGIPTAILEPVSNLLASYVGSYPDSGLTSGGRMIEAGNASAECGGSSLRRWQRHLVRDEGVAGSNPATPTNQINDLLRWDFRKISYGDSYGDRNPRLRASCAVIQW